jgi:hypothetical protein
MSITAQADAEWYRDSISRTLQDLRDNPDLEKFAALKQALLKFIDVKFGELNKSSDDKIKQLQSELEVLRKQQSNAVPGEADTLKEELGKVNQALELCKSTELELKKKAAFYQESLGVIDSVNKKLGEQA